MSDYRDIRFLEEVRLYDSSGEREKLDNLSELYAVIIALENLEKILGRDYISPKEYTAECSKLLTQFKVTLKLLPGLDFKEFLIKYKVNCPAALERIQQDRPTTVKGDDQSNSTIAEIVALFITLQDQLKLNIRAVDELFPILTDLRHSMETLSYLPADFDGRNKVISWHQKLNGMSASEEIPDEVARQMVFELETAYNSFMSKKAVKSAAERALEYVEKTTRIRLQDLRDNPGARVAGRLLHKQHNQHGHTIGEIQRSPKPPLGWIWGDFYRPWHRMFPGERSFNGDINLRREYVPLSLLELQRLIDLNWIDPSKLIDISVLCNTRMVKCNPKWRQFGIHLTDEGAEKFSAKINIEVQWADQTTIGAIEKAGGRIRTAYYDLTSLEAAVNPQKWLQDGKPVPGRKMPPHSLVTYYIDPNNRGYLAKDEDISKSEQKLAEILEYDRKVNSESDEIWKKETKKPNQVFLGLNPGSLVSLMDKKVFEPTHPAIVEHFNPSEPLADHLR